ncbi:uncharacterized protein I303_107672 [Kwoniella dejecticola CBS 10117]|uniref:Uncharacterized protein n=1 Tax=Kwoniella dejecticola CBS 10117 TaxID=1296121 RepID=A0A1A5ZVE0_9TREE|nr:uncharacterized protein I303_07681 [Kwoniella dejecticola CBS 10117]OBR81771.1 hypothetical protein I303_07681 [Kwoniella dejecticola CBS 10117]
MGIFNRRARQNTASVGSPNPSADVSSSSSSQISPQITSTISRASGRHTPLASPALGASPTFLSPNISLKVAIDPLPSGFGGDKSSKYLFPISVNPDEGIAAIRREAGKVVGQECIGLFKVSIPQQAFQQARAYKERYGKSVHLLSQFPAFNLDDAAELPLSLGPTQQDVVLDDGEELKVKDWFPEGVNTNQEIISIIARPLSDSPADATTPATTIPLTLRAYFAQPPQSASCAAGPSALRSTAPPLVVDIDPHTTVDELKAELLRAAGKDPELWSNVVLWKIQMTESEMTVIDELGRLKNGKMPWPYPPGAMEPISMSDGNLPVSLFFPKSAPNGDMLNLSVWFNPASSSSGSASTTASSAAATVPALANEIPHFRYPMTNLVRPASTHCSSPSSSLKSLSADPIADLPPSNVDEDAITFTSTTTVTGNGKIKKSRIRPSTAPASVKSFGSGSSAKMPRQNPPPIPFPGYYSSGIAPQPKGKDKQKEKEKDKEVNGLGIIATPPAPPLSTTPPSVGTPGSSGSASSPMILTPPAPLLDRTSFSSTVSTESDLSVQSFPSPSESKQSLDTVILAKHTAAARVSSPSEEKSSWLGGADAETTLKKSMSINKGSIRDRLRKVL